MIRSDHERRVTLVDVARAAGVDASTVSRFVNGTAAASTPTQRRVAAAVAALGYTPDRAARRLAGGRAGAIGIVVPDLTNPFFAAVVRGAQRAALDHGDLTMIADSDNRPGREPALVGALVRDVDAVVLCSPTAPSAALVEAAGTSRAVVVNRRIRAWPSVVADQTAAVETAVDHLRALGHRTIAFVRGPSSKWISKIRDVAAQRLGMLMLGPVEATFAGGAEAAGLIPGDVTGVVAHNDLVAVGLVDEMERRGRHVPGDLSVVGCDDIDVAALARPRLTTVAMPLEELGALAVDVLFGADGLASTTLGVRLVARESTGPR